MRRSLNAKTRLRRQSAQSVSLFPFLAVLICTMGALIVLLVVINQQAILQASREAMAGSEVDMAQIRQDLQDGLGMAQLMSDQLDDSNRRTQAELMDARFNLGQVEQHAQRLAEEFTRLQATLGEMDSPQAGDGQLDRLRKELQGIEGQILLAQQQLDQADAEKPTAKPVSYAIIPYEGAHGTNRRPVYIECLADAVVIQPEGIRLTDTDFLGTMGPGNPLDVALRAIREHLVSSQGASALGPQWEPYPLMLVRPSGIMSYRAARQALASWGSEVGYELIDEDWPLKFPEANPALAREVQQAVAIARRRNQQLAAMAPSHFGRSSQARFSAQPRRNGGQSNDGTDPFGRRFASGESPVRPIAAMPNVTPEGTQPAGTNPGGTAPEGITPEGDSSTLQAAVRYPDTANREPGESHDSFGQLMNNLRANQSRESVAGSNALGPNTNTNASDTADDQPHASGGEGAGPVPQASSCSSLAKIRGRNWGLNNQATDSIPLSRPIRVECFADRLVVVPNEGTAGGQIVALKDRTEDTIDTFITALWDHMASWKNAGQGMHWRPTLNVYVADDALHRFADLNILLEGSGVKVKNAGLLRAESWRTALRNGLETR